MTGKARFRTVLLVSAATVLPLAALNAATEPASIHNPAEFVPPSDPMVLTRQLRRALPGGAEIVTERSYEIRFVPDAGGYRIDGTLIAVRIDVPAPFEPLAALERAMPDSGMFPMDIDRHGRFVTTDTREPEAAKPAQELALSYVPAHLSTGETHDARAFINQTSERGVHTAWPVDLFSPAPGKHSNSHIVPLPGGKTGQVSVDIEVAADPGSGILQSYRRLVTTRLAGTSRITDETWTLAKSD